MSNWFAKNWKYLAIAASGYAIYRLYRRTSAFGDLGTEPEGTDKWLYGKTTRKATKTFCSRADGCKDLLSYYAKVGDEVVPTYVAKTLDTDDKIQVDLGWKDMPVLTPLDFRLVTAGYGHVPLETWQNPASKRSFLNFLRFWRSTQSNYTVVGSTANADVGAAFTMWAKLGHPTTWPFDMAPPQGRHWTCLRRISKKDIPRATRLAQIICDRRIALGDRKRLLRAPPEVRWLVNKHLRNLDHGSPAAQGFDVETSGRTEGVSGRIIEGGYCRFFPGFTVVKPDQVVLNWEAIREEMKRPDFYEVYAPVKALWMKYHRRIPKATTLLNLPPKSVQRFHVGSYLQVKKYLDEQKAAPTDSAVADLAVRITMTFGKRWKEWLKRVTAIEGRNVLHDSSHWLPNVPTSGFGDFVLQVTKGRGFDEKINKPSENLMYVATTWDTVQPRLQSGMKFKDAVEDARLEAANVKVACPEFAREYIRWGKDIEEYTEREQRWLDGVRKRISGRQRRGARIIPDFNVAEQGYQMTLLEPNDPRSLFLGEVEYTGCCQKLEDIGESCAWHGATNPCGGFVVVTTPKGEILAQSWVWRRGDVVVFDNVEALPARMSTERDSIVASLYEQAAQAMMAKDPRIKEVHVGEGNSDLDVSRWPVVEPVQAPGVGYTADSSRQRLIAAKRGRAVKKVDEEDAIETVVEEDPVVAKIRTIEQEVYPEHMQMLSEAETMADVASYAEVPLNRLRVLHGDDWYVIIGLKGRGKAELVDIARRRRSAPFDWNALVSAFHDMRLTTVKLDAREDTLYPVLQRIAPQYGLEITEGDTWDWEGDTMHEITLHVPPAPKKALPLKDLSFAGALGM